MTENQETLLLLVALYMTAMLKDKKMHMSARTVDEAMTAVKETSLYYDAE